MRVPVLHRIAEISDEMVRAINVEERLLSGLVFSSETPVRRWFGMEVLDHNPSSVDLSRIKNVGSVLMNHDPDRPVAKPENVRIENGKGIADARFGTKALAEEAFLDVREGVIRGVSVGYIPLKMQLEEQKEGAPSTYRVMKWQVLEYSLTPIPADPRSNTGMRDVAPDQPVFREGDPVYECEVEEPDTQREEPAMKNCGKCGRSYEGDSHECTQGAGGGTATLVREDVVAEERARVKAIRELAARHKMPDLGRQFEESGRPVVELRDAILEKIGARETTVDDIRQVAGGATHPAVGLNDKEIKRFSFFRLIRALMALRGFPDMGKSVLEDAAFEIDACRAQAKILGREPQGAFLPNEVVYGKREDIPFRRDITKATEGADLVQTLNVGASFIDLLRNKTIALQLGTVLTGLKDDILIPRLSAGATGSWVTENTAPAETTHTFDNVQLSAKSVTAFTDLSRKLLIQASVDVENIVRNDLAEAIGIAIDSAAISGSGVGEIPTGITTTGGTGSVTSGGTVSYPNIVELWSDVAGGNADIGTLAFLTSARVAGILMETEKATGYPVYLLDGPSGKMLGYPVHISNQVPAGVGAGTIIFGNWKDLLIGMWDALDLLIDPFSLSSQAGTRVRVIHEADVELRRLASFSTIEDIT
jgi:HK97 family phage major capsid protein